MTLSHTDPSPGDGLTRLDQSHRRSRAIVCGTTVYLAGQVADDASLDIHGQTVQALRKVDEMLAMAGTDKGHILSAQIWLKSVGRDLAAFNEIWDAWVIPGRAPTRCCGQVELTDPRLRVEIMVTAALPQ